MYTRGQPGDLAGGPIVPGERICVTKRAVLSCSSLLALEAPSEDLDVMERSPNLPLHFADENLEPSASCGLNALVRAVRRGHEALDLAKYWQQKWSPN